MQYREMMANEKVGPVFQRHDVHRDEMQYLSTLAQKTFQECLKTVEPFTPDTPTIVNPAMRQNSTFHHEYMQLRSSLEVAATLFLRKIDVDQVYAAQMGFSESRLLCRLKHRRNSSILTRHAGLRWAGFPSVLSLVSFRDFCGVECGDFFVDPSGRRGWAYTFVSVEHPSCPPQADYVRGWLRLAHVFLETSSPGLIEVISFVQADMKGNAPQFIARHITKQLVKDTQKALVQTVSRRRRSSMSSATTNSSKTWTMDSYEAPYNSNQTLPTEIDLKDEAFYQAQNTLVDEKSLPKNQPAINRRGSTDSFKKCSSCHVTTITPTICKVCEKVSCPPCSLKWSIVYKYDVKVHLCYRCYDGLILHRQNPHGTTTTSSTTP